MKCVAIGDNFITPDMMKIGIESNPFIQFSEIQYFFFGVDSRHKMRNIVKIIETGGFETVELPEGLLDAVEDADVIMCHLCPITETLLKRAKKLKLILCNRGGHENIDVDSCTKRDIAVLLNPSHNANAVAEFTVGLIFNETRNITRSAIAINNGIWREKYPNTETKIHEMCDMTIGLIGFGSVAKLVYEKMKVFNCKFLISDPFCNYDAINKNIAKFVSLDELLQNSDIVSIHARLSRKSILLGENEFKKMKKTAYFINTARSYMVDYDALANALKTGKIMGAAIDVFNEEPIEPNNPLIGIDNCTLTNHRGGDTINSYSDSPATMIKEAQKYFEGDLPKFWLNPSIKRPI
ncbi:MAG: 3-phosphoglycerate dehydrogenase [Ruminococcaceae bacterium]|nr:3-phosphoglycerate dehydrogenase [Oscillospiraceae bacterium]